MIAYHPTLWRTCRVLASPQRLACLKEVLRSPGSTVEKIAVAVKLPHDKASLSLRALQARGLVSVKRRSRWAHYAPQPDPLVPSAAPVLAAMRRALITSPLSAKEVIATLAGFTHPRRLTILHRLYTHPAAHSEERLLALTHISAPALYRHLKRLESLNLIHATPEGWLCKPKPPHLARTLLAVLIKSEKRPSAHP